MSEQFNLAQVKAKLSELVERAAEGEEIVIAKSGRPRARLVAVPEEKTAPLKKRRFGVARHWKLPPDDALFAPMTEEDIRWATGAHQSNGWYYTRSDLKKAGVLPLAKTKRSAKAKARSRKA